LLWCWSMGSLLAGGLRIRSAGIDGLAMAALAIGGGLALLSFLMLALSLVSFLTDATITAVLVLSALSLGVQGVSWWRRRGTVSDGVLMPFSEAYQDLIAQGQRDEWVLEAQTSMTTQVVMSRSQLKAPLLSAGELAALLA